MARAGPVTGIVTVRAPARLPQEAVTDIRRLVYDQASGYLGLWRDAQGGHGQVEPGLKGALKAEILRAIRAVASGEAIFGPVIAKRLINYFAAPRPGAPADAFPELTEREKEILAMVAQHQTNPEIARRLHLSTKTIRNHVSNVFTKLQVADRAEAIIRAHQAGLGNLGRR